MPIYELRCNNCGAQFEKIAEHFMMSVPHYPDSIICPCCNEINNATKLFSVPTVIYKGPGFYTSKEDKNENS
jgi:putative FmdB family regulatory protein